MIIAKQSTARTVIVGPALDADGAAVTDLVVGDFKISKNGGAPAALNGSATLTHLATGHYSLALTASDMDTVGQAEVILDDGTNACAPKEITVVEEAIYDALFASGATGKLPATLAAADVSGDLPVDVVKWMGTTPAAYSTTRGTAGTALPDAAADAPGGLPISDAGGLDLDGLLDTNVGSRMASYTHPTGFLEATFPETVASPTNITAGTITTVTNLTNLPSIPAGWLTAAGIADGAFTAAKFASGAFDAVWSASSRTLTSFGSLVADIWAALVSGLTTTGSIGKLIVDNLDEKVSSRLADTDYAAPPTEEAIASQVRTELATELGRIDQSLTTTEANIRGDAGDTLKSLAAQVGNVGEVTDKLDEMIETDSNGDFLFTALALSNAPTGGGGGGDATEANQLTIIAHLEDIKGATFDISTDSLEAIRNRGDSAWITATGFATPTNITNAVSAIESHGDANWATATGFATASDVTDAVDELKSYGDLNWVTATGFATADALQEAKEAIDAIPTSKEGYKLAADGLALVVPTDPGTDEPVFGTSSIVTWIGFFGAVSLNKATVNSDTGKATIRNSSDTADLVSYSISDDGTEFVMGPAE